MSEEEKKDAAAKVAIDDLFSKVFSSGPTIEEPKKKAPEKKEEADVGEGFSSGELVRILNSQDRIPEKSRLSEYDGYLHLSSLLNDFCARRYAISARYGVDSFDSVTGGHRVMWNIGRAMEAHIRKQIIESLGYENVYGVWKCICGRESKEGLLVGGKSGKCNTCKSKIDNYHEIPLKDDEAMLVGNPDLLLFFGGVYHVVEIKSINAAGYLEIGIAKEAHINHKMQALGYRRLLGLMGKPVAEKSIVVYGTKEFVYGSPYTSFDCQEDSEIKFNLDEMWKEAKDLKETGENLKKPLPPKLGCCESGACATSEKCPCASICLNL